MSERPVLTELEQLLVQGQVSAERQAAWLARWREKKAKQALGLTSRYVPHQGTRERARRVRREETGE